MHVAGRRPELVSKLVLMSTCARADVAAIAAGSCAVGGPRAGAVAERDRRAPDDQSGAEYAEVCFPLYTFRGRTCRRRAACGPTCASPTYYAEHIEPGMDLTPSLAAVRCPTLVLVGEQDPICPPSMSELIVSHLRPDLVRFERFEDCGHGTYRDEPDRTEAVLREFLGA